NDASQDPLFVNSSGNTVDDLKLTAMSPAVDTGTDVGAPAYDLLGLARPQYNGYDMGALEFIQPPLPPASADPAIWTLY
ncbi:MAG: choice-of-anchor Q domain-containing protein, partial [Candidatus Sumerlaeia bacterium]